MVKTIGNVEGEGFIISPDKKIGGIHRKVYSSAAEVTHTGDIYWTDTAKTFDLTAPVNSLIIGINILVSLKSSYSTIAANVKLVGTNLGTLYCIGQEIYLTNTTLVNYSPTVSTENTALFYTTSDKYAVFSANINKPIKILDTTTAVTFRIKASNASTTAYLKDAVIEVIYIESFEEDV